MGLACLKKENPRPPQKGLIDEKNERIGVNSQYLFKDLIRFVMIRRSDRIEETPETKGSR